MMRDAGDCVDVSGALTLDNARAMLEAGCRQLTRDENVFDLAAVGAVDSSGLAVVFGWVRAAQAVRKSVRIIYPPQNLLSLAALYGVTQLLPPI